jgi:O-antigen ligase/tetratricopeptide (TPR) repeat protein
MPSGRTELVRLGVWGVLLLSGLFFLTTGGTYPGIASVDAHVLGQIIGIAALGGWLAIALLRQEWRPRTPLLVPLAIASGGYLASAVASQRPRLSLEPTMAGLGWALALLFLSTLLSRSWFRVRAAVLMTAFIAVVAIGYLIQVGSEWATWWGIIDRFAIPPLRPSFAALFLGSPNLIATALMLWAPLVVVLALARYPRWIGLGLALASAAAAFVSGSRGAYLGIGLGVLVAFVLYTTRRGSLRAIATLLATSIRQRPLALVPGVGVIAVGAVLAPSVILRFAQGGGDLRIDLWKSAITIFGQHPILGAGPGTWVQLKVAANPPGVPNLILPHAHDMYVQAAAELGIVGLLALGLLAVAVVRRLWAAWRSERWLEAGAVIASLAALAGQSIVDNFSNLPFVCLMVVTLVAWVDGGLAQGEAEPAALAQRGVRGARDRWQRGLLVPAVGLIAIVVAIPNLLRINRAAALAEQGSEAALHGYWQIALDGFDAARSADPGFTLYEIQTAGALARAGRTAEARDLLAHSVEADPVPINVIGVAALEASLGDRQAALAHVRDAVALGIGNPVVALNAGLVAERIGETGLAIDQFANAIAWDPPLAVVLFYSESRAKNRAEILLEAKNRSTPVDAALILAYSGDAAGAQKALDGLPTFDGKATYAAATTWLAGDAASALSQLQSVLAQDPTDWYAAAWAARIARLSGLEGEAQRYSTWALTVQADAAEGVIHDLSQVPATDPNAGLPGNYPWAIYLRPISPYLPVPQLTLVGQS